MSKLRICICVLVVLVMATGIAVAQTATGEIRGRVADQQGAVIAGAKVSANEVGTGRVRTTTSSSDGTFTFGLLPPATYEVTVEAPNMAKGIVRTTVLLHQSQDVRFTLKPATAETVVEVSGEAPIIETTNSELKTNVNQKQIQELPLRDRNFASLATLSPNVRPVASFDPTKLRTGNVSINGNTGRGMNLTVDGGDNKDNVVGGFLQNYTTEGIQEFVVESHRFGADTGKSAGGVVTIATKTGTNDLHGSFFGFLRNKHLNAKQFFEKNPNEISPLDDPNCSPCWVGPAQDKAPFQRINWGGSLGGPIIKNKLYFFGATEFAHENTSIIQTTAPEQIGAFIQLRSVAPTSVTSIQNAPLSAAPTVPTPFRDSQWQIRGDYNVNPNNVIYFRYAQQNNKVEGDQITGTSDPNEGAQQYNDLKSALGNWTWTISPRALNTFSYQYSTFSNAILARADSQGVPNVFFAGGVDFGQNGNVPQTTLQNKHQLRDDFNFKAGKHTLKFGFQDVITTKFGGTFAFLNTPSITLYCDPSDVQATGLCGNVPFVNWDTPGVVSDITTAGGNPEFFQDTINQISYYFQDDWKVTPRLTLNLGVRNDVDYGLVPTTSQNFNRTVEILRQIGADPGVPSTDTNNWAPRIGFAWDTTGTGRVVVRGGYGMFFDQLFQNVTLFAVQAANPSVYGLTFSNSWNNDASGVGLAGAMASVPAAALSTNLPNLPWGSTGRFINKNFQNPYSQQWTLGVQVGFGNDWSLAIDGIHVLGLHEFSQTELNPRNLSVSNDTRLLNFPDGSGFFPGAQSLDAVFGCQDTTGAAASCVDGGVHRLLSVRRAESNSRSSYNSLTFELRKRFAKHFQMSASYVLSQGHTYALGQAGDFGNRSQGLAPGLTPIQTVLRGVVSPQNYGWSSEDERHRFVFNGLVELPWGFIVSGIVQLSSARPYTMNSGFDNNGDGVVNDMYSNVITGDPTFDPRSFGDIRFQVPPNSLRGNPYYQTDLRIQKNTKITERVTLEAIADLFNLFNQTNFGDNFTGDTLANGSDASALVDVTSCVTAPCTFPTAKQLTRKPVGLFGGGFGGAGTIGIPFEAQLGLRLRF